MSKKLSAITAALVIVASAATLTVASHAAAADVTIKFAHNGNTNPNDPQNVGIDAFKKMVEERSGGDIKVNIYPAGQLGDARTIVESVQMGSLEMGDVENGPMGRFVPEAMLWDLPFIFRDIDHAHAVLDGDIGKQVQKAYLDVGIRHLAYNDGGFRYFTNDERPIEKMADLEGLKVRVMESEVMINTVNAFGASAVPMSFGELYSSLQQGVVDGQENPMNLIYSQRFYEVQKYLSLSGHFYYPRQYIASESWWQGLSDGHKSIIATAAREASDIQRAALISYEQKIQIVLEEKGMLINKVDKTAFIEVAKEKIYPASYAAIGEGDIDKAKKLVQGILSTQ
tara:strand:- start:2213 stop:3235 length:1023 start_codon:yes stop_codon:yes gene_type:complete